MNAFERNRNAWDRMGKLVAASEEKSIAARKDRDACRVALKKMIEENERLTIQLSQLRSTARKYLQWSDSGAFRDGVGLRPGISPMGEDLRSLLGDPTEHKSYKG